ncbi:TraX family protein [Paenibacillus aquistagni]|uniref:TraX protein n=1 Tax=Paenibacillus aquistagni TaxID=1852522 RepID=A0A1X7LKG5_9BACL|nr:TraX family protein [Paenibacillus aquistagni]SMG54341.1 TraX protein [Paenibacillus aquistagni]
MQVESKRFGMDAFWLKIIAMLLMVLDHVNTYIFIYMDFAVPAYLYYPGRIVSPIFFYFLVEGFFHTRSRMKYGLRLLGWAAIMAVGSWLLVWLLPTPMGLSNNILLSLSVGVVMMSGLHRIGIGNSKQIIMGVLMAIGAALIMILYTEASMYGVLCVLVFYYARSSKWILSISYIAGVFLLTMVSLGGENFTYEQLFLFDPQWMMVFALPFILLYNGKRGYHAAWSKYLFYVFYPVHLWIIYSISYMITQ